MKYQMVIRIPYEAMDDIQARQIAYEILSQFMPNDGQQIKYASSTSIKLQRLQEKAEPIGISFDTKKGP